MELKDKIKLIRTSHSYTQLKFSEKLDMPMTSLRKYESGQREPSGKALLKIIETFPQHALWLTTGDVIPEGGQVAPGDETPKMSGAGVPEELLNTAFEKAITTSISLGWLTAKPEIQFSMLSDLMRHDFVEQGGKLIAQDADENESQTA